MFSPIDIKIGPFEILGSLASGPDEELLNVMNEAGGEFLIKRLSIFYRSDLNSSRRLDNERSSLQNLDHSGIPNCLDSPELDGEKALVFEKSGKIILADMIADRDFWDSLGACVISGGGGSIETH